MTTKVILLALTAIAVAIPSAANSENPIPGYGVQHFTWEVPAIPGKASIKVNGTVEEVRSHLLKINPNYDADFLKENQKRAAESTPALTKRDQVDCDNYPAASRSEISNGINYLNGVAGQPSEGPGPGNCGQVSCSYNAAIWWCNDNTDTKTLPGFYNIAQGAQVILDSCDQTGDDVAGQDFHSDNWNVVVRSDSC